MDDLKGKVAVVTGGASGIGFAMAERLAGQGMRLAIADIEEDALESAAKQLTDGGADVLAVPTDVSKAESVDALADRVREHFGGCHVVCNNAGVGGHGFTTWDSPMSEWEWVLGVNLWGVIHGIRAFVPALVEQDEGHVVNTASLAGLTTLPFMAPYSASKHAVLAVSEALFHELAMMGSAVKVSVLCPGFIKTRIADANRNWLDHLGPEPARDDPASEVVEPLVRGFVEAGKPPEELADQVLDAIQTARFSCSPSPRSRRAPSTAAPRSSREATRPCRCSGDSYAARVPRRSRIASSSLIAANGSSPKWTASMPTARAASTLSRLSSTNTAAVGDTASRSHVSR